MFYGTRNTCCQGILPLFLSGRTCKIGLNKQATTAVMQDRIDLNMESLQVNTYGSHQQQAWQVCLRLRPRLFPPPLPFASACSYVCTYLSPGEVYGTQAYARLA